MGTVTNPEPSQPAPSKPASAKPLCSKLRLILFSFIFFIAVSAGTFAYGNRRSDNAIGMLLSQNKHMQASLINLSLEIELLQIEVAKNNKRVPQADGQGLSDESREAISNELDLLRLSYKELRKDREVMAQQIEELRRQLKFVQNTELMEIKMQHQKEVEMLRAEILQAKKELLLIKQDLAGNMFDEKLKHKFNDDVFSSKNKEDVKSKPQEWIENVYQTASEGLMQAANGIGDTAKSGFEKVKSYVDETAPKISEKIKVSAQETIEKVKDLGQQVGESAKESIQKAKSFIDETAPKVQKVGKAAKENFEKVKDFVGENVPKVASQIGKTAKEGMEKVKDFVGEKAPKIVHKIEETAKESFETVKEYVGKTAPKVASKVGAAAKDTFETLKSVGEKAKETSGKIADQAKELMDSLFKLWKK